MVSSVCGARRWGTGQEGQRDRCQDAVKDKRKKRGVQLVAKGYILQHFVPQAQTFDKAFVRVLGISEINFTTLPVE